MAGSDVSTVTHLLPRVNEGFITTLNGSISSGATTVPLNSTSGLVNGTTFVGIIEPNATNQQVFTGTVDTGGGQITNVVWTRGANAAHSGGVTIVDYVTGTAINMLARWASIEHSDTGTHGNVTATGLTVTGTTAFNGSFDGWVGANESWTYASSTTITVPSDATTKYDVGDYIKLTQSSTVKYFVVTGVAATVLTVSGLSGVTVANAAITLPAYSKTRTPHGAPAAGHTYNPYKFSVYRNGAWTQSNSPAKVQFDTKLWDTSSNFDATTNFRFTAPVAGFYMVGASIQHTAGDNIVSETLLYKNGSTVASLDRSIQSSGGNASVDCGGAIPVLLAASDYLEIFFQGTSSGTGGVGTSTNFWGFLISAL